MERRGRVRRPRVAPRTDDLHSLDIGDIVTTDDGLLVHLRRSKTDQTGTGRTVAITATTSGDPLNAVAAWVHWRNQLAAHVFHTGPAWRAIDRYGARPRTTRLTTKSLDVIIGRRTLRVAAASVARVPRADRRAARRAGPARPPRPATRAWVRPAGGRSGRRHSLELGRRLGVTKQAAAKHIEQLERLGYRYRAADAADGRRKLVRRADVGHDVLARSAAIFDDLRTGWAITPGEDGLAALEHDLREVTRGALFQIDAPGWFGGR
jgi:DNA-binding MarR family transcriptional regulator